MRSLQNLSLIWMLIVPVLVLNGCKKSPDKRAVTIVNHLNREVTFDLYGSEDDYNNNTNVLRREVIGANQNLTIPGNQFEDGNTYYMDWYSEDYYYNNWYNDNFPLLTGNKVRFKPEIGANTYYLKEENKGYGRIAFLRGSGKQTSWIAVGAYLYSTATGYTNQWSELSVNERYRQVVVNKNGMAAYTHRNTTGTLVTDDIEFMIHQSEVPYIEFKPLDGSTGSMTGGKLPTAAPPSYTSTAVDTVMAIFPDNEYYFMMVRQ